MKKIILTGFFLWLFNIAQTQIITTVAGGAWPYEGSSGLSAQIQPNYCIVDPSGNVFFSDANHKVLKLSIGGFITTYSGNGNAGFSGDGGLTLNAQLNKPSGLARDASGNIYIAEQINNRIRKVSTNGVITTIAGIGTPGYSGDGGQAISAQLNSPRGIAIDASGNIYVADRSNHIIRKIATNGVITTIAGTGTSGFSGDGGQATYAQISYPNDVKLDGTGNIYISDAFNQRIRKIATTGLITTIAGTGLIQNSGDGGQATAASLNNPQGIAIDAASNIYIASRFNIRKIATSGIISTIAGTSTPGYSGDWGQAILANIYPLGITVDGSGNIYIADFYNRIRKISVSGIITTIGGNGNFNFSGDGALAINSQFNLPRSVTLDKVGNIYIADYGNSRIRKVGINSLVTTIAGIDSAGYSGDGGLASNAKINSPMDIKLDSNGNIYFVEYGNNRIRKISTTGVITTIAGNGTLLFSGDGGQATAAGLPQPYGLTLDAIGNIFVSGQNRIRKIDTNGIISTFAGTGTAGFSGDGGQATAAQLNVPDKMAIDPIGNFYFADKSNHRIRKISTNGIISTVAGNGFVGYFGDGGQATSATLNSPSGLTVDLTGNIFITDGGTRIRKIINNGIINTIAGDGNAAYGGDNGLATNAQLNSPIGISLDLNGNIYIADYSNNRIRKVTTNNTVPIQFNNIKAFEYGTAVKIEWSVSNEININKYEVESSTDGIIFNKINSINANNINTYNCLHTNPNVGNNYYRIISIANDGKIQYSQIVNVKLGKAKNSFNVFPNPIQNNTIQLQLEGVDKGIYNVVLYNQAGQQIFKNTINHAGGSASESLNTGKTSKGIYQLVIEGLNIKTSTKTIIVE